MARGVKLWIAGTLGACLVMALAYLPPRGGISAPESRFAPRVPKSTPARLRAQGLAEQWRAAQSALQLLQSERDLGRAIPLRAEDSTGLSVLVDGPDSVVSLLRPLFAAQLDTVWRHLGLAASKISVHVIVATPSPRRSGAVFVLPTEQRGLGATYLLPDSTDRTTCAVLIPAAYYTITMLRTGRLERMDQFREWLKAGLGPCAFYAAYGTPGMPVRRWMARRGYDLALYPGWDSVRTDKGSAWFVGDPAALRSPWYWEWVYQLPTPSIACMAGRPGECSAGVLSGSAEGAGLDDTLPRVVSVHPRWWKAQPLVPGERYLADVAREVGRDRFLRFWNSTEPVDTALAAALKMPIGDWTERWERRFVPRLPLGPAAPPGAVLLALLLAAAAVATVALTAPRRQVR